MPLLSGSLMCFHYKAFDLTFKSEIDLLLPPLAGMPEPDVTLQFGKFSHELKDRTWNGIQYGYVGGSDLVLGWGNLGRYWVRSGKKVIIDPILPLCVSDVRLPVLGIVMATILQQRGNIVLHGSSVLLDGKAVIFLGNKGEGKSTLANWLVGNGFALLSDDICSLESRDGHNYLIQPAFSSMRLNPDVLLHCGDSPEKYPQVHPAIEKRTKDVEGSFCASRRSVGAICILSSGNELRIERVHGIKAVQDVLPHMISTRFPSDQPLEILQSTFLNTTQLVKSLPVYRVIRPRDMGVLEETASLICQKVK